MRVRAPSGAPIRGRPRAGDERIVDVTARYAGVECLRRVRPLVVRTNEHVYLPREPLPRGMRSTWLSLVFEGLERLREIRGTQRFRDVAVVGTGDGLDAVGISRIFKPRHISASDVHPRVLDLARWNIGRYIRPGTSFDVRQSDLFRGYPASSRFDLVYENLPNLPTTTEILRNTRAASCYRADAYPSDGECDRYRLTLHYNCLLEALPHLEPAGCVVSAIGGRAPRGVLEAMFRRAGFEPVQLNVGLKVQTEAELVVSGYSRAEEEGSPGFIFYYPVAACVGALRRCGRPVGGAPLEAYATSLNAALEPYRLPAREALPLIRKGKRVCHSVYVIAGTPRNGH